MPIYRNKERGQFFFEFDRRIGGQRVRATRGLPKNWSRAQAEAFDRSESERLYAVAHGVGPERGIEDAVAAYLTGRVIHLKAGFEIAGELKLIHPFYRGRPLSALADVCKAIALKSKSQDTGKPLAPATIKKRIRYLTAACRWAWKHAGMGEGDPAARVSVPTVKNDRQVFLDRRQMLALARACQHRPTRALIRIAFYSGMRLGEIERARVVNNCFVLDDTKNGEPRVVPVHPRLNCCLKYQSQTRYMTHYHFFKARKAADMPWLHFHDLRHSFASAMVNAGVDMLTVGSVLGHKSHASTKRYAHIATQRAAEAIFKIGRRA